MLTGRLTHESEGAKAYVFFTILVAVMIVVLWVQWLNAKMGGGRPHQVAATPAVSVSGGVEIPVTRATPYRLGVEATTPTLAPTRIAALPVEVPVTPARTMTPLPPAAPVVTVMPTPTPTPVGEQVQVILSTYWPDDGPDWCLTWEDSRCVSPLTSGDDFRAYVGRAFACDPEWLGHTLVIPALQMVYPCLDTGISFACEGGPCTVGLLSRQSKEVMGIYEGYLR